MKRDLEFATPTSEPMPAIGLLNLSSEAYWLRLTTGNCLYHAEVWSANHHEAGVIIHLQNARIRDPQGRDFVTHGYRILRSPVVMVPFATRLTVSGEKDAFHVPLPRACSVYLEQRK